MANATFQSHGDPENPGDAEIDDLVGAESETDAEDVPIDSLSEAVVAGTDWTVATILDQMRRGNIDLSPKFQRRGVWQASRKSRFIESLILGLPVPQIVLAEKPGERGRFIVLDGKQRLLTLRQFCSEPTSHPEDAEFELSRLRDLNLLRSLNGSAYADLRDEPGLVRYRDSFDNNPVRTVIVRNWPTQDYLYLVFLRLNTGSVPLSPQELRQALQPGPFTDYVDDRASESVALRRALNLNGPDFRMRDTEVLLRALAFETRSSSYTGNMKLFLDSTCQEFNESWPGTQPGVVHAVARIEKSIDATISIFGERNAFSRYSNDLPERRFNRAVFDVMVHSMGQPSVARRAAERPEEVRSLFSRLCDNDSQFLQSITATTKSLEATKYRYEAWARGLAELIDRHVSVPVLA